MAYEVAQGVCKRKFDLKFARSKEFAFAYARYEQRGPAAAAG